MQRTRIHLLVGIGAVAAFLATGVYMKTHFPQLYGANAAIQYQFRANHVYILMSGLVNLMAGFGAPNVRSGWREVVSKAAAFALLSSPLVLIAAFAIEPLRGVSWRPLTAIGVLLISFGVLFCHLSNGSRQRTVA